MNTSIYNCICIIILGQMFLLDRFFDGTFFTYGIEVMSFADRDQEDRIGELYEIFVRKRALVKYQSQSKEIKVMLHV